MLSDRRKSRSNASGKKFLTKLVKNFKSNYIINGAEFVENSAPLLAFCQFEFYRTFVRRRIQIVKI